MRQPMPPIAFSMNHLPLEIMMKRNQAQTGGMAKSTDLAPLIMKRELKGYGNMAG